MKGGIIGGVGGLIQAKGAIIAAGGSALQDLGKKIAGDGKGGNNGGDVAYHAFQRLKTRLAKANAKRSLHTPLPPSHTIAVIL